MNPVITDCRDLFLNNLDIQRRLKATTSNEDFIKEAIKICQEKAQEEGLEFEVEELTNALQLFALTGEGNSDKCPSEFEPPLSPATVENLINLVRGTPVEKCAW